jgi:hypothetical protein
MLAGNENWETEALQNQVLREYFWDKYERETGRSAVAYATSPGYSQSDNPSGLGGIVHNPNEERRIEEHVNRQIFRLVRDIKAPMVEIASRFSSLAATCGELSQPRTTSETKKLLKQLEEDLGGIRKKAKAMHGRLAVIFSELPEKDDFQTGLPSRIGSPCSLDELNHGIELTLPKVREAIAGTQVVSAGDLAEHNVLLGLYHLYSISEHLLKLVREIR